MRGASERPCAARVSLQLWLAVRKEQAKAAKLEKAAIGRFFDTLKGRRIMRRPFPLRAMFRSLRTAQSNAVMSTAVRSSIQPSAF